MTAHPMHCHYCNCRIFLPGTAEAKASPIRIRSRDHKFPKRFVPRNEWDSIPLLMTCADCNILRNDAPYEVFKAFSDRMRGRSRTDLHREWASFRFLLTMAGYRAALAEHANTSGPAPYLKLIGGPA